MLEDSRLVEFEAEAKLTSFTFRRMLKGARDPGGLWRPAKVVARGGQVRVSTSDGVEVFRPRRLTWKGLTQFSLSGLDPKSHLKRAVLRFQTVNEAESAASAIKELQAVQEERLEPSGDWVAAELLYPIPTMRTVSVTVFLVIGRPTLLMLFIFLLVQFRVLTLFPLALIVLVFFLMPRVFARILNREVKRLPHTIWFREESEKVQISTRGKHFIVLRSGNEMTYLPLRIEWKSGNSFELVCTDAELRLAFATSDEAAQAYGVLQRQFPRLLESRA